MISAACGAGIIPLCLMCRRLCGKVWQGYCENISGIYPARCAENVSFAGLCRKLTCLSAPKFVPHNRVEKRNTSPDLPGRNTAKNCNRFPKPAYVPRKSGYLLHSAYKNKPCVSAPEHTQFVPPQTPLLKTGNTTHRCVPCRMRT